MGVESHELLYVGEGLSDLNTVFRDEKNPGAVFAFQEAGAKAICSDQDRSNKRIRRNAEPLGFACVDDEIKARGLDASIIRMTNGAYTIFDLLNEEYIKLTAPHAMAHVHEGQLVGPKARKPVAAAHAAQRYAIPTPGR
jgi:hypothetical protein